MLLAEEGSRAVSLGEIEPNCTAIRPLVDETFDSGLQMWC